MHFIRYHVAAAGNVPKISGMNSEIPALTVALPYKLRWRIELFFRWIKGHLRITHSYRTSPYQV
jgi:IS4 transposase